MLSERCNWLALHFIDRDSPPLDCFLPTDFGSEAVDMPSWSPANHKAQEDKQAFTLPFMPLYNLIFKKKKAKNHVLGLEEDSRVMLKSPLFLF